MKPHPEITFFHSPNSRAGITRSLLEELNVRYDLVVLDLKRGEQRTPDYLAINSMGKVPAIRHHGVLITEQPAIMLYLADAFPEAGLAPAINDPLRGAYLRWMVFYGSCFEPALIDRSYERAPLPQMACGYGDYDSVINALTTQLAHGPWLLGESFTAADVLWGGALNWALAFKLVPESNVLREYVERVAARPAMQRAAALDAELAEKQAA
ncbi:MAG TPA: glutathione S-transferase family protein [Rhodanobacteraceae bacterium]|nr:glutathione S-transferase family protein [Rhodanobacteraceae bacterium]